MKHIRRSETLKNKISMATDWDYLCTTHITNMNNLLKIFNPTDISSWDSNATTQCTKMLMYRPQ